MIRFIHAADLHLDSPLRGIERYEGAPAERIRGASRKALANLVDLARAERVAFVVLAGDIYDGDWHDVGTGHYFVGQMARLRAADIPVFLVSGNHDAANAMTQKLPYPDNVRIFRHDRPETFALPGVVLHGQSFAERAETRNLALGYPGPVKGSLNVGVLHTSLTGREPHETYAPCLVEDLASRNYDYWALGHVHKRETVQAAGPRIEFPGNIQGRTIREVGAKGCLLVTSPRPGTLDAEFRPLDVVRWSRVVVACDGAVELDDVHRRVSAGLDEALGDADGRLLVARVELVGECAMHDALLARLGPLREAVRALAKAVGGDEVWIEKTVVSTTRPSDTGDADVPIRDDALSEFAAVVDELRGDPEKLRPLLDSEVYAALASKVPDELKDAGLRLDDPAWASSVLGRALAILNDAATGKEAGR